MHAGAVDIGPDNPRLLAGILAGAVAWRTRNTLLTIVSGMLALHFFGFLAA
jgi:branched-subunit amino acid transport protein